MTTQFFLLVLLSMAISGSACASQPEADKGGLVDACLSPANHKEYWLAVRKNVNSVDADQLAPALTDCLRSRDPALRDHVAYEVLTHWLRGDKLSVPVKRILTFRLQGWLMLQAPLAAEDPAIGRAFSALVLSELVRADERHAFLSKAELAELSNSAAQMFSSERDYRGLVPDIGWIHALAHGSDLLWRLSLHPEVQGGHLELFLGSIADQMIEANPPPFVFNEADRIARVIVAIALRSETATDQLKDWLIRIAGPGDLLSWNNAFSSVRGMNRLHNTKHLLRALREKLSVDGVTVLVDPIDELLQNLP